MTTAISVNKYIYSILSQDNELKRLVGNKIYPLIAEESTTFPFIIFKRNNVVTEYCKDGKVIDRVDFSIAIAARNYTETIAIAERCRELLELKRNDYFNLIHFNSISEDYVDDTFIQELHFTAIVK